MEMKKGCLKHPTSNIHPRTPNGGISRAFASLEVGCSRLDVRCFFFSLFLLLCFPARAAEEFGDISVSAAAMFTGNTFHGYGEMRVTLENHSHSKAHVVTLAFPNNAYNNGNSLGRLARSVKLGPEAREVVSLFQPPLPANGDGNIRVEVDGRHEGEVRAPNANNHCNFNSRGGQAATVFISRSLDYDAVQRVFQANSGAFTAAKAVGAPDTSGSRQPTAWMPDTRRGGQTNWLELDYATPQTVNKVVIYIANSPPNLSGVVELIGTSGTNIVKIPMSSGKNTSGSSGWQTELSFSTTVEPVKSVRLNFGKAPPYNIAIDAVQIAGPTGTQWASDARASSDNSASARSYAPGRVNADSIESLRAESPVSEWGENWLAYSPFDAVVLNAADMAAMSPAVLAAIGDYLSAGGNVVLSGKTDLPAVWHPAQKKNLRDGVEYNVGFGRCFAFSSENPAVLDSKSVQTLRDAVREAARYWQTLPADSGAANAAMPVVENIKIPTRGIVVIMLAFIIIIGPVNIIYLNRRKRRTWMLWTIPAISFATTLLVFAYSLLREGITPDTRIAGLTVIDQASHHVTTIGATAFYCPLTPSGGLHFDYETEATPLVSHGYGSGTSREVDWTQSQHFSRGWVSARVPVHFHLRKSETRRERIQVVNENGKLQVVNGLGAPIKSLWVADADMNIYAATSVAAGQKAGLIPSPQSQPAERSGVNGLWHEITYVARPDPLDGGAGKFLTPNSYIAVLDGNPFIENALGSASSPKRTKSSAIVFGILDSAETGGGVK
jgi:hypothetical protein